MRKLSTVLYIVGSIVIVSSVIFLIGWFTASRQLSTVETTSSEIEVQTLMDTTAASMENVKEGVNYYDWTVEEVNSAVYNYAGLVGENPNDVYFVDMYMTGGNYNITFASNSSGKIYTAIFDSERYLIRVDTE